MVAICVWALALSTTRTYWMGSIEGLDIGYDSGNPEKARGATMSSL